MGRYVASPLTRHPSPLTPHPSPLTSPLTPLSIPLLTPRPHSPPLTPQAEFDDTLLGGADGAYGPALEPLRYKGEHFEVVTRCISNRAPEFTKAVEEFVGVGGVERQVKS